MDFFDLEIDEKSRAGSQFMARVVNEIRRAIVAEKKNRKITQQGIAEAVGTSRAVINRQVQGYENLTARRIAEILWAIGWEPHFEARPIPKFQNDRPKTAPATASKPPSQPSFSQTSSRPGPTFVKTFERAGEI
ncbi:winged helix-turn-helix domain-containing protein [Nitrobacter sp.]|uniref:helix-turn-helix domain-containing protein n=1 Tax=Nitrobacter sp. TaxID=29420 RepID=UPI0029CAC10F|nr:winged helix-turn-helix domain-containing protein [Nitrobacter sp.]